MKGQSNKICLFIATAAIIALFVGIFSSCSAESRLSRILKNNPNLIHRLDSTIIDTFIVKEWKKDTLVSFSKTDTIRLYNNGIETKIFHYYDTDSVFIYQKQRADTIIKTIKAKAKAIELPREKSYVSLIAAIFLALCLLVGLIRYVFK